jgi:hypothetical protein
MVFVDRLFGISAEIFSSDTSSVSKVQSWSREARVRDLSVLLENSLCPSDLGLCKRRWLFFCLLSNPSVLLPCNLAGTFVG